MDDDIRWLLPLTIVAEGKEPRDVDVLLNVDGYVLWREAWCMERMTKTHITFQMKTTDGEVILVPSPKTTAERNLPFPVKTKVKNESQKVAVEEASYSSG